MLLEKIITLANKNVELQFRAMERSLRATGCHLPLLVIPYNDNRFELPANSSWFEDKDLFAWLDENKCHRAMRKYLCLTQSNYHFADTDLVFLKNPAEVLKSFQGFITSCGHWRSPGDCYSAESEPLLRAKSTLWPKLLFNTGQFACDKVLYKMQDLMETCLKYRQTCIDFKYHEQPAINLLVNIADTEISNITLPPVNMESTWAGDYRVKDYSLTWNEQNKPYLIHWAGSVLNEDISINELFLQYLTKEETAVWNAEYKGKTSANSVVGGSVMSKVKNVVKRTLDPFLK